MILLIDNYDSFTYNVYQVVSALEQHPKIEVIRNDQITVAEVKQKIQKGYYQGIIISPGPGRPEDAGITIEVIKELGPSSDRDGEFWPGVPILGICLGHQAIGDVFGGKVVLAPEPIHGKISHIYHQGKGIFAGIKNEFTATRYHSLVVDHATLPASLEITAQTEDGLIMGLQHRQYQWIQGVQFHPESIMTELVAREGLLTNFLNLINVPKFRY